MWGVNCGEAGAVGGCGVQELGVRREVVEEGTGGVGGGGWGEEG